METNSFPYKLAAVDLDGTLLDPEKKMSKANVLALRKLEQAGVTIVLASGRTHDSVMKFQAQLELTGPVISSHGAIAKDSHSGNIISFNPLTAQLARNAVSEAKKKGATVIYCQLGGVFTCEDNEWTKLFKARSNGELRFVDTFESLHVGDPYKIIWMHKPEVLSQIHENLDIDFVKEYYIARGDQEHLEFLSNQTNKGAALEAVAKHFNIARNAVLSFGDADNDIPMLLWAGLGVAMNHATAGAKAVANLQTPAGLPETSFARAVEAVFAQANT